MSTGNPRENGASSDALNDRSIVPANGAAPANGLRRMEVDHNGELGAYMGEPRFAAGPRPAITPRSLWRYKGTVAAVFAAVAGISVPLVWAIVKPEYSSSAKIRVAPVIPTLVYNTPDKTVPVYNAYLNSQVTLISSTDVLRPILEREDVRQSEWFRKTPYVLLGSPPTHFERLNEDLMVTPLSGTELIDVTMTAGNPKDAALIVNAVVDQYRKLCDGVLRSDEQKRFDTLSEELKRVQGEIVQLIDERYQVIDQSGAGSPPELRAALVKEMERLNGELLQLQSGQQAISGDMRAGLFSGDAQWVQRRDALEQVRYQISLERHRLGDEHPRMQTLLAEEARAAKLMADREAQMGFGRPGEPSNGSLEERRTEIQRMLTEYKDKFKQGSSMERDLAQNDEKLQERKALRDDIRRRLQELQMESKAPGRISLASAGLISARPAQDRRMVLSLFAMGAALMLGIGAGCLRISADASIHEMDDVTCVSREPFLGQVPFVAHTLKAFDDPHEGLALRESVRMVRTALLQRLRGSNGKVMVVTSPGASAGKTTMSIMLGRSIAQLGKRVLVVDADFARPELSHAYGSDRPRGLRSLLAGRDTEQTAIVPAPNHGFDLLPGGAPQGDNDMELLANGAFVKAMDRWRKAYDVVLVDAPPVLAAANAGILASQTDGTIFVLRASHSRRTDAMRALALLSTAGAKLVGTILVGATDPMAYYSSHYYKDRNGHTTRQDDDEPAYQKS